MAIQKDECPAGGKHAWGQINPGTLQCSKCGAIRKTGNKANATTRGEVNISTLLLILVVIASMWYFFANGKDKKISETTTGTPQTQATPEAPKPTAAAQPAPTPVPQAPDPVALLKGHLDRLQKSCAAGEVIHCRDGRGKVEVERGKPLQDLRYDVQKTSSLISPYLARISFKKPSLRPDGTSSGGYLAFDIALALQDSQWVLTDLQFQQYTALVGFVDCNDPTFTALCRSISEMATDEFRQRLGVQ